MSQDYLEYEVPYYHIRQILSTEYANASPEEIEDLVALTFGESAEDLESYLEATADFPEAWGWIKRTAKRAGRAAQKIARTAAPIAGTALGAYLGGPAGAQLGGTAGGMLSQLLGGKRAGRRRPRRRGRRRPQQRRGRQLRAPGIPQVAAPGAANLLKLLERPELRQSLLSMLLGNSGREFVQIGEHQIPATAILESLSELAQQSISEYNAKTAGEASAGIPEYLQNDQGEILIDPADAVQQAELVMAYFELAEMDEEDDFEDEGAERRRRRGRYRRRRRGPRRFRRGRRIRSSRRKPRRERRRYREDAPVIIEYDDESLSEGFEDDVFWEEPEDDDFDDVYEIDDEDAIFDEYDEEED